MNHLVRAAALVAAAFSVIAPAKADYVFSFNQVGEPIDRGVVFPAPSQPLAVGGTVVVSNAAAANGFSISLDRNDFSGRYNASLSGLVAISLTGGLLPAGLNTGALLERPTPPDFGFFNAGRNVGFTLSGSAATGLTGTFSYFDLNVQTDLTFAGDSFTGQFRTENALLGCSRGCTIGGTVTGATVPSATAVPEPPSLALFGAGLLGLAVVRRRAAA
ncbi:PEP-CTERM sorting domain-containing protein [Roseomonas nepalensis]|uniref:PEP-CTERM sorting domain-containing protein n=1 Tax=Muricoccus nepalensis TaxID=1854500 RepID=A0A502G7J0_9PROT|nr:PEP-CTERM sorting domain-containing protein [Roseomonas nepalensis]TPG58087.1 PEP-CTERM sorting domain-containing protein [Roseomonas nepalensis]